MVDPLADYRSGSTEPTTVEVICAMIRALQPGIVLETGTFEGCTTRRMLEAMASYADTRAARLYSVEYDAARMDAAQSLLADSRSAYLTLVGGDAVQFIKEFPGTFDFAFIDDDHTASHVTQELSALLPKMNPGGVVCMHDVVGPFGLDKVCKSFGGVVLPFQRLHVAGGLGIVVKQ